MNENPISNLSTIYECEEHTTLRTRTSEKKLCLQKEIHTIEQSLLVSC